MIEKISWSQRSLKTSGDTDNVIINIEKDYTYVERLSLIGIEKENVLIFLNEQPLENWGGRGGVPADEMNLDFKVDI